MLKNKRNSLTILLTIIILFIITGNPITTTGSSAIAASKQVSELIGNIRHTPDGESLTLSVKRENKDVDVAIQPQRGLDEVPTIGVFLQSNFKEIQKIQSNDVGEAAQLAFGYLTEVVTQTAGSILSLLGMLIMGKGPPPGQSVSGPIGLIKAGTEIVSTKDVTAVLLFASALSVNLGVINALPLPALDGGQLVFVIAEALTGRKVNQRLQEGITGVAIFFLLIVSVSTAFSDVGAIISGR
jgi:RIP metalloprotease RseP